LKKTGYDSKNYAAVVSLAQKQQVGEMGVRTILAESENEKFSGMAGSDLGFAVNGDIVTECAAMQLPTVIINETSFFHSYFTLLYNSFSN
jgi:hypothetical protein